MSKPKFEAGGEVRTNYEKGAGLGVPVPVVVGATVITKPVIKPSTLIPEGKLELKKEYKLKGGLFIIVESRNKGSDPGQTPMVVWKKGHPQPDHTVKWAPSVEAVELFVEKFVFDNLIEEE